MRTSRGQATGNFIAHYLIFFTVTSRPTEPTAARLQSTVVKNVDENGSLNKEDDKQDASKPYHVLKQKLHKHNQHHRHHHHQGRTTTISKLLYF